MPTFVDDFGDQAIEVTLARAPAAKRAEVGAQAPIPFGTHPPAADALVLVETRTRCRCGAVWLGLEPNLFLRTKAHFSICRLDTIFTRDLPKEIKVVTFPTDQCRCCFGARGASVGDQGYE